MKKATVITICWFVVAIMGVKFRQELLWFFNLSMNEEIRTIYIAVLSALFGSIFYCGRSIYDMYCVRKEWDDRWIVWYLIRPFNSIIIGFAVWLILKSGINLAVGKDINLNQWTIGFISFVAGMNVKNVQFWIEKTVKSKLGISPSNQSKNEDGAK